MKIDRRCFLSLGVGAAAGTAISPLPWKLMDDSSIWTQMWPWTPVPPVGEVDYIKSVCTLCSGGCGIAVRKVGDRAVKIEGLKGHPVNDGGICNLGLSGLQMLYGPTRIKTPLKKTGKRGEGKWKKISWDEAVSELASKLGELRKKGQSHKIGCISGLDRNIVSHLINRFFAVYGSPNYMRMPSMQDSYELALYAMHGVRALPGFDFEKADFILSFGSGIIDGWGSPVRMFKSNSKWQQENCRVVQIEPRLSNTAAKSDKWIPINPGTEGALALGLAHVIIKQSLYNKSFIGQHSFGFYNYTDDNGKPQKGFKQLVLDGYDPDKVAKITGIDKGTIVSLAKGFARASKPIAICGRGQGHTPGNSNEFMAVHALNALTGNINQKGGVLAVCENNYINWPEAETDKIAATGMQQERMDGAGSKEYPRARYLTSRFAEAINSEKYPMQALFVAGANPCYTLPDSKAVKKAFDSIPFVVSFSSYMDETAQNSDLVLPNHTFLERFEDVPAPMGLVNNVIGLSKPVVAPLYNTKHTGDVIISLAKAMGGSIANAFPWDSYKTCLEETLKDKWETLVEEGFWTAGQDVAYPYLKNAFNTSSEKFEFAACGNGLLPDFTPVKIEGDEKTYPLILIPFDSMRLAGGFIGNPPFVIKTVADTVLKGKDCLVEINPETAKNYGLTEGKDAVLTTPKASVRVKVHLFDGIMPGLVALPRGLGHTGYDKYLAGKGVNVNELIGPVKDPCSGHDSAWGIRARLAGA